jgi:hypothetical protein
MIIVNKQGKKDLYYFVDTREDAKTSEAFGIDNADVAKTWTRDYNNGEGPFQPVDQDQSDFQINRRDLQQAGENETPNQITATEHNLEIINDGEKSVYDEMTKEELIGELEARGLEYKKNGPESTNASYIKKLVADDNK